jgi:predicted metal-dependent enzyme (double-stranded beta helix superfamily)
VSGAGSRASAPTPIQPALAPLAQAAKAFSEGMNRSGSDTGAFMAALRTAVGKDKGWLRPEHRVGDPARYMRHLLYVDPDDEFVITAITWLPGQQSPVHGHYVWCAFGVAEGELVEETFRAPGKLLEPVATRTLHEGDLADLDLGGPIYHRVSNRSAKPLVTLHLYGVASGALTTGINRLYGEP